MIGGLALAAAIAAEALATYTVAAWLGAGYDDPQKHAVSAFSLVGMALVGFWLPRLLEAFDFSGRARWGLTGGIAFLAIYGALRLEFAGDFAIWDFRWAADFVSDAGPVAREGSDAFAGALFLFFAWAWAAFRSQRELEFQEIPRMLGGPFALVIVVTVIASPTTVAGEVGRGAAAFFTLAIAALALSQSARSGATFGTVRAGGVTAGLLLGTAVATGVSLVLFGLLWGPLAEPIGSVLGTVVGAVLTVILTPIAWLLERLLSAILGDSLFNVELDTQPVIEQAQEGEGDQQRSRAIKIAGFLLRALVLILLAALVLGVLLLFSRFRRQRARAAEADGSASGAGNLADDLRGAWRSLFRRDTGPVVPSGDQAIRLYREVLDRAEERGHPRSPGTTPEEFAPELAATFQAPVTDEITAAFEQARYAGRPPGTETVAALEGRWRQLRDDPARG